MKRFRFAGRFRFQSVLMKTVLLLFLFTVLAFASFAWVFHTVVTKNFRETEYQSLFSVLSRTSGSVDTVLEQVEVRMEEFLEAPSTTSYLVAPERNDFERMFRVSTALVQLGERNDWILHTFLYLEKEEQVLTDGQQTLAAAEFPDRHLLEQWRFVDSSEGPAFYVGDSRLFLLQSYPVHKRLGLLVVELDTSLLFQKMQGKDESLSFYPYTSNGTPVLPAEMNYPEAEELLVSDCVFSQDSCRIYETGEGGRLLCRYQSGHTGWNYVTFLDSAVFPPLSRLLPVVLPLFLVFVLLVFGLAHLILKLLYRPMEQMLSSWAGGEPCPEAKNEWDLLWKQYSLTQNENQELSELLRQAAPALTDQLFHRLLLEEGIPEETVRQTLDAIGGPFSIQGRFLVLALQVFPVETRHTEVEEKLFFFCLKRQTEIYFKERCPFHLTELQDNLLVCILSFPETEAEAKIKEAARMFEEHIKTAQQGGVFCMGMSRTCPSLLQLSPAYREARQDFNYRRYYQSEKAEPDAVSSDALYWKNAWLKALQKALEGEETDAGPFCGLIKEQAGDAYGTAICQGLHSETLSFLVSLHLPPEELSFVDPKAYTDEDFFSRPEAKPYMKEFLIQSLHCLIQTGQKNRVRYVAAAKKYMEDNYADSSLSLDAVSRYIGISPSYLSTLFSEQTGQNAGDYLRGYRIGQACRFLVATEDTVAEIGFKTGFNSANSFIRAFKKRTGKTPGQYRDSSRRQQKETEAQPPDSR